jgi:GntR family transcriptional regulator
MLPFVVALRPDEPPYRQVVFAATRAIVAGELAPGEPFPSVRELSQALKINPNTAHKVVAELVRDGLLEVRPGLGTVVAAVPRARAAERRALLAGPVEQLVVEAKRLGLSQGEVLDAVQSRWTALFGDDVPVTRSRKAANAE